MKLVELYICPNCGGKMTESNGQYDCPYCGKSFREENIAEKLAEVKQQLGEVVSDALMAQRMEDIANARRNLYAAIHEEYINSGKVLQYSRELKKYLSDDVQANFYETAVSSSAKSINRFIDNIDVQKYDYLASDIIEFMIKSLEKKNILSLKNFAERAYRWTDNKKYVQYMTRIEDEAEKIDKGIYKADLPRRVFLAYSSADAGAVHEITEYLEDQGLSCFVSERNLRHGKGAVENYKSLLETAMRNCKCVVFLSSESSRSFNCDALDVELPYIKENLPDMGRVEYIVEEYKHTPQGVKNYLKDFFDGLEFCRTKEDLVSRILNKPAKRSSAQTEKYCVACGSANLLKAKLCCECGNTEFADTYEEYIKIKTEERVRQEYEKEIQKMRAELEKAKGKAERVQKPQSKSLSLSDFEIKKGVLKKYKGKGGHVVIPDSVTSIEDHAFSGCGNVIGVEIPSSVASIGSYAFSGCISLTHAEISDGVTSMGDHAFQYCSSLTEIDIPNSVASIGSNAFQYCSSLKHAEISSSVSRIESCAFSGCGCLKRIKIPDGVTSIEEGAFHNCGSLTDVKIPNSVTSIGNYAFRDCGSLTNIEIPSSVSSIGYHAFWCCKSLKSIKIPNGVTSIGNSAFSGCSGLKSVEVSDSVMSIGSGAFYGCGGLTSITIPFVGATKFGTSNKHFGYIFGASSHNSNNSCVPSSLKTVTLTGGTSIEYCAFGGCGGITSIVIPNSVASIEGYAFKGCNKNLTIYCKVGKKPSGWDYDWDKNSALKRHKVVWEIKN